MNEKKLGVDLEKVLLVKSGLAIGGASFADLTMASYLKEKGHDVSIMTGYAQPFVQDYASRWKIPLHVDSSLDRYNETNTITIKSKILARTANTDVVMFSQALCTSETKLGEAAIGIAEEVPTVYRQHNHLSLDLRSQFNLLSAATAMPITRSMEAQTKAAHPAIRTQVVPPLIDSRRFEYTDDDRKEVRQSVRENYLDLDKRDESVVVFQPVRVDKHKGLEYTLDLVIRLEQQLARRCILLVAGGDEPFAAAQELKRSLLEKADARNFTGLRFMNGSHTHEGRRRVSDVMIATDIVAATSEIETFGLGVAEAALSRTLIVAKKFKDDLGNDIYREVYGDFNAVVETNYDVSPTDQTIVDLANITEDNSERAEMLEQNHELAQRYTYTDSTHAIFLDAFDMTR